MDDDCKLQVMLSIRHALIQLALLFDNERTAEEAATCCRFPNTWVTMDKDLPELDVDHKKWTLTVS